MDTKHLRGESAMKAIREQHRDGLLGTLRNRLWLILWLAALLSFAVPWVSRAIATDSCTDPGGCWATKADMPTARTHLAAGVVNNKIYAIGGYNFTAVVEEYNPATDQWTTKASMPTARYGMAVGVVNNKIYAIGGTIPFGILTTVDEYDPVTDTWTNCGTPAPGNGCTPMPTARSHLAIGVVNNKIYAIGGNDGSVSNKVEEYNPVTDTWTNCGTPAPGNGCTPMPTARGYLAVGVMNNKISVLGGGNASNSALNTVEEYDPATDTWTNCGTPAPGNGCTPMPTGRNGLAVDVVNNKIYAIGGFGAFSGSYFNTVEEGTFSPPPIITVAIDIKPGSFPNSINLGSGGTVPVAIFSTSTFDARTVDPTTVTLAGAQVALKGKGTLMSSVKDVDGDGLLDLVVHVQTEALQLSDTDTEAVLEGKTFSPSWATKTPMPTARGYLAAGVVNNKVYAIGGTSGVDYATVEEYDPATDTWTNCGTPTPGNGCTPMPTARNALDAGVANNKIYAIGGGVGSSYFATVEEYDPATNTWTNCGTPAPGNGCTPMPTGRVYLAVGMVNNKIYAIGGYNPSFLTTVEEYDPAANQWTTKASMPTARYSMAVGVVNNKIYAIGGTIPGSWVTTVEEYDPATDTWTNCGTPAPGNGCSPMPTARGHLAVGVVNNKIYAIGGCGNPGCGSIFTTVEEYDPATNTWTTKSQMPGVRYNLAAGVVNNKIYAIGGNDGSYTNKVEEGTITAPIRGTDSVRVVP